MLLEQYTSNIGLIYSIVVLSERYRRLDEIGLVIDEQIVKHESGSQSGGVEVTARKLVCTVNSAHAEFRHNKGALLEKGATTQAPIECEV